MFLDDDDNDGKSGFFTTLLAYYIGCKLGEELFGEDEKPAQEQKQYTKPKTSSDPISAVISYFFMGIFLLLLIIFMGMCGDKPSGANIVSDKDRFSYNAPSKNIPILQYQGHRYAFYTNCKSYDEAVKYCEKQGGHMATIDSEGENYFLFYNMKSQGYQTAYFGARRIDEKDSWHSVTGKAFGYSNWYTGNDNKRAPGKYGMLCWLYSDRSWISGNFEVYKDDKDRVYICEWDK